MHERDRGEREKENRIEKLTVLLHKTYAGSLFLYLTHVYVKKARERAV